MLSNKEEELRYDPDKEVSIDDGPLDDQQMLDNDTDNGEILQCATHNFIQG